MTINLGQCFDNFGFWRRFLQGTQYAVNAFNIFAGNPCLGFGKRTAGQIMGGNAQREASRPCDTRAGQRQKLAHATFQPLQIPAAADIWKQANARFRHRKFRILGRHAETCRLANAHAATHRNAVHESDDRLGISEQ